jgi:micrococcal nuclease
VRKLANKHPWLYLVIVLALTLPSLISTIWPENSVFTSANSSSQTNTSTTITPSVDSYVYSVKRVVDGDTIVVLDTQGQEFTVRLIGVDTPETVDPRQPVQCFGKEASDFAKSVLTGLRVSLVADPTQADKDQYGRLLRYLYLPDNSLFNLLLISEGYAHEYTYRVPYQLQVQFQAAQQQAQLQQRGLWGSVCNL